MAPALGLVEQGPLIIPKRSAALYVPGRPAEPLVPISFPRRKGDPVLPCQEPPAREFSGTCVPVLYLSCGILLGLCNLVAPDHIRTTAFVVCPIWTAALGLHAAARPPVGAWGTVLLAAAYPFLVILADDGFSCLYALLLAGFAWGRPWEERGLPLVLGLVCWLAAVGGVAATAANRRLGLNVAFFATILLAVMGSRRLGRVAYKVYGPRPGE